MFDHALFCLLSRSARTAVLLLLLTLSACTARPVLPQPTAVQGVLDLRAWDFSRDGPVRLDGDWSFYWDASRRSVPTTTPREFTRVPGTWLKGGHPTRGKALYKLRVLTKPSDHPYGMKLYELPQSYRLYIDDQRLIENGRYSETPEQSARSLVRPYVVFTNLNAAFDVWIEVVNLNEDEPGPRRSIVFGLESDVRSVQEGQLVADMTVSGVLIIMALYHLALYAQRRRETGSLLFGLLCLAMLFRIAVTEEHYLHKYVPQFPATLEHTLDVFSFFILAPVFAWIFSHFFQRDFQAGVLKAISGVFVAFSVIYIVTPSPILFNFYLLFTLAVGLYLAYVLFLGVKRRRSGSGVFLAGFLLFVATTVWDMLSYSNIVRTIYVSQIGFVGFIFAQAYVLSMRFNQALATSEQLTVNLEGVVAERTAALEESNRKLAALNITDALTGIANRRHFDQVLHDEWNRALRNQRPLALLVLDIDHFKAYNDHYGHQSGDQCLRTVAGILATAAQRAGDTVARYGGEEFAVILPDGTPEEAVRTAEHIRQRIETAALPHAKSSLGVVSVSIGAASVVSTEDGDADGLFKQADDALYTAKRRGRNQVHLTA